MARILNRLAAAGEDLMLLWNINTGQKIETIPHNSCALSECGRRLSSP
jgi:hypothetical protein